MAASAKNCGYDCKLLEQVSDEFFCKECKRVARDLTVTECCGQHYCKSYITPYLESNRPCPECGDAIVVTDPQSRRYQKQILALKVSCQVEDRGCKWTGLLRELDAHLDIDTGDCQFVDIHCPNKCGQQVLRGDEQDHLNNACPKRAYDSSDRDVTGAYKEQYPEREGVAGGKSVKPEGMELQKRVEELEKKLKAMEKTSTVTVIQQQVHSTIPPITFTVHNFAQLKAQNSCWTSPPFYSHLAGYKLELCLKVWPNGEPRSSAHNKAVTVRLCSIGHDRSPLADSPNISAILQLLNQHMDQDHHTLKKKVYFDNWPRPPLNSEEDKAVVFIVIVKALGWLFGGSDDESIFINHQDLDYKHNKQYLKNDCLQFRVLKLE